MQGDIESVAALSAKDLTALIEQVSGSAAFKKEYDRCAICANYFLTLFQDTHATTYTLAFHAF